MLPEESGEGIVLFPGVAGVVEGESKEPRLASGGIHEGNKGCFAAKDLVFELFDGQVVEIGMLIAVVPEIESPLNPFAQNRSAGHASQFFNTLLDDEAGDGHMVVREGVQQPAVGGCGLFGCEGGGAAVLIALDEGEIVDCQSDGSGLRANKCR